MHDRNYRGTKVMQVYDLENNFLKHRQRIIKTRSKDMVVQVKMQYRDQMQKINSFRKNWNHSHDYQTFKKQKQVNIGNKIIHESLTRQYNRDSFKGQLKKLRQKSMRQLNSSRISLASSTSKRKSIDQQNMRLVKRLRTIESTLSKEKMLSSYNQNKSHRERLQVFNLKKRDTMKSTLRKMNIQPTVYFPKVKIQKNYTIQ